MKELILVKSVGCYECRWIEDRIQQIARDENVNMKIVDRNELKHMDIGRTPCLLFMNSGFEINRIEGLAPEHKIKEVIRKSLTK